MKFNKHNTRPHMHTLTHGGKYCSVCWRVFKQWYKKLNTLYTDPGRSQTSQNNFSCLWVTYPLPHKRLLVVSPSSPARQVCCSDLFCLKMEAETLQTQFLCSEYLLFLRLPGPVLPPSCWAAARAADMTALTNKQLEWERPVRPERYRCTLTPSEYKQLRGTQYETALASGSPLCGTPTLLLLLPAPPLPLSQTAPRQSRKERTTQKRPFSWASSCEQLCV